MRSTRAADARFGITSGRAPTAWRETRPAELIAASRSSTTACSWSPTTRACSRSIDSPASFSGTSRWPTRVKITDQPARRWWSTIWRPPAYPAGTKARADSCPTTRHPRASVSGASGPSPRRESRGRKPGWERISNTGAGPPGSPALTIPKRSYSIGPLAIRVPITTARSARATISIPRPCWHSIQIWGKLK